MGAVELTEFMIASSVSSVCRPVQVGNIEGEQRDLSDDEGGFVAFVDPFNKQLSFCSSLLESST